VTAGVLSASRLPEKVRDWVRQSPECNWAIATGKTVWRNGDGSSERNGGLRINPTSKFKTKSDAVLPEIMPKDAEVAGWLGVLDVDPRNGGDETLSRLEGEFGRLPETWAVQTGGLGMHYYFLFPQSPGSGVLGPGLELKGDGGYVAIPPSEHASGRRYEWESSGHPGDVSLVMAPSWLIERVFSFGKIVAVERMPDVPSLLSMAFARKGWRGARLSGGGYAVRCPWSHEHTDGRGVGNDSSSAVLPPSTEVRTGAFACQHSHCKAAGRARKGVREVMVALELPQEDLLELASIFPDCERLLRGPGLLPTKRPSKARAAQAPEEDDGASPAPEGESSDEPPDMGKPPACRVFKPWHKWLVWGDRDKRGQMNLRAFSTNVLTILENDPFFRDEGGRHRIRKNANIQKITIHGRPAVTEGEPNEPGIYFADETSIQWIQRYLEFAYLLRVWQADIASAIMTVADRNETRPLETWLRSLVWDGTKRVDDWLSRYVGAPDTSYTRAVGRWWLVSAVARAFEPGCKADHVLILEGGQGRFKSTAVEVLASCAEKGMSGMPHGEHLFMDTSLEMGTKDSYQQIRGKWIVELAEMTSVKKGDVDKQKMFISASSDTFRDAFGRITKTWPRTCVFIGTVNPDGLGYLRDATGARRFWPVETSDIDIKRLRDDAAQLWAEATSLYLGGARWYPSTPEERALLEGEQRERLNVVEDEDVWLPVVAKALYSSRRLKVTLQEVFSLSMSGLETARISQSDVIRMAKVMAKLGWRKMRHGTAGKSPTYLAPKDWMEKAKAIVANAPSERMLPVHADDGDDDEDDFRGAFR
jgi:predicted P-loop ATPase